MDKVYYGVLFHYNAYTGNWNCFERNEFNKQSVIDLMSA